VSALTDAVERLRAHTRRTGRVPPLTLEQASCDLGLVLGTMEKLLASQCVPEHDHHVMPHRGCPLR